MTNVFAVVGEHRWEPGRLLLLGEDGRYYAYRADGAPMEVEPTAAWNLDEEALASALRHIPATVRPYRQPGGASLPAEGTRVRRRLSARTQGRR